MSDDAIDRAMRGARRLSAPELIALASAMGAGAIPEGNIPHGIMPKPKARTRSATGRCRCGTCASCVRTIEAAKAKRARKGTK